MTAIKPYAPRAVNRVPAPSPEDASVWNSTNPSVNVTTRDQTIKHSGTQSVKSVRAAASPTNIIGGVGITISTFASPFSVPVTIGEVISGAVWVYASQASRAQISFQWRSTSANLGTATLPLVDIPANVWSRISFENVAVPNIAGLVMTWLLASLVLPVGINTVGGETFWLDDAIINAGTKVEPYFDGNVPGCSWSGTVNASQSIRAVQTPWTQYDGTKENPLDVAGLWDGAASLPVDLRDVTVV